MIIQINLWYVMAVYMVGFIIGFPFLVWADSLDSRYTFKENCRAVLVNNHKRDLLIAFATSWIAFVAGIICLIKFWKKKCS